jgi:hypothetical protein
MLSKLTNKDYRVILNYYNVPITKSTSNTKIKDLAEDILATKLCKCIKSVQKSTNDTTESRSIAICKDAVIKKKKLHIYNFSCKNNKGLIPKKNTSLKLLKTSKTIIPQYKGKIRPSKKTRKL